MKFPSIICQENFGGAFGLYLLCLGEHGSIRPPTNKPVFILRRVLC